MRWCVARLTPQVSWARSAHPPHLGGTQKKGCEYKFYTEFQSHEPEFDYLKSLEIEEKINKIKWCKRQNAAHFLLSTNGALAINHASIVTGVVLYLYRQDNQTMEGV